MTKSSKIKASPATLLLMLLRLGTLNVRGFKDENKQRDVIHFARMHNVDILLLQETNLSRAAEVYELKRKFSVDCFFSLATRQFCGAGILILKKDLLHKHFFHQDYCGRILTLDLKVKGTNIRIANIYAPVKESEQNPFFETLNAYLTHSMPIILGGDFNNVLNFDRDARSPKRATRAMWHTRELRKLISNYDMTDVWVKLHGQTYGPTWERGQTSSRIDRIYVTPDIAEMVTSASIENPRPNAQPLSDHRCLKVELVIPQQDVVDRPWRLSTSLLVDEETKKKVGDFLHSELQEMEPTLSAWIMIKKRLKQIFQECGRRVAREHTAQINAMAMKIRILDRAPQKTALVKNELEILRQKHTQLMKETSLDSRLKAYKISATGGPNAYEFLHQRPRTRIGSAADNHISSFTDYYRELFTRASSHERARSVRDLLRDAPSVDPELYEKLEAPPSAAELDSIVNKARPDSSPGLDGLPWAFYKVFWPQLRRFFTELVHHAVTNRDWPQSFTSSLLVPIPKDNSVADEPGTWRPISLLNVDYKIIMSLLANRLQVTLETIIDRSQHCSVPSRNMYSHLSATRDLISYVKKRNAAGYIVSLDQKKAYDRVEHEYLFTVLREYQFPDTLIATLRTAYAGNVARVCMANMLGEPIQLKRGIRQGCPLAPILFIIAIDPYLRAIQQDKLFRGIPLPGSCCLKVLAYADDVTLYARDEVDVKEGLECFQSYARLSGAELNIEKSNTMALGSFRQRPPVLGLPLKDNVKILGITFNERGAAPNNWDIVKNKIDNTIKQTPASNMYMLERVYVVKAALCAKAWHVSRIQLPSPKQVRQIHKTIFRFIWSSPTERVPRDQLFNTTSTGGLSVPNLYIVSRQLALRTALHTLEVDDEPAATLLRYWLGPLGRHLEDKHCNLKIKSESPGRHQAAVVTYLKQARQHLQDADLRELSPSEASEKLPTTPFGVIRPPSAQLRPEKRWGRACPPWLPANLKELQWKVEAGAMATRDRLAKWRITRDWWCTFCGQPETSEHVFTQCRVAKAFWRRISWTTNLHLPLSSKYDEETSARARGKLRLLYTALGRQELWQNRCFVDSFRGKRAPLLQMVSNVSAKAKLFLETQLELTDKESFEESWRFPGVVWVRGTHLVVRGMRVGDQP